MNQDRDTGMNKEMNIRTNKKQIMMPTETGTEKRPTGTAKGYL